MIGPYGVPIGGPVEGIPTTRPLLPDELARRVAARQRRQHLLGFIEEHGPDLVAQVLTEWMDAHREPAGDGQPCDLTRST